MLYILWRVAEDVGIFFKPNNPQRRREILHELVANQPYIMTYIGTCLQSSDMNLCLVALRTLTGFLEWSAIDPSLLTFLCNVLSMNGENSGFLFSAKLVTTECILVCLQRKGLKQDDLESIGNLYSDENLSSLMRTLK